MPLGVLLLNIGGPSSADERVVRAFLRRFFSDPAILPVNPFLRRMLAKSISRKRAPESARRYAEIGGRSPVLAWTEKQARGLEERLGRAYRCVPAMRYAPPLISQAIDALDREGCREFVSLPLYPHESCATTGSALAEVDRVLASMNDDRGAAFLRKVGEVRDFAEHPTYVAAIARRVEEGLARFSDRARVHVLFSANGLPQRFADAGDPYPRRIDATVAAVVAKLGAPIAWSRAYQSRVGPEKWLGPDAVDEIRRLAESGTREILVVPVSFVSDHVETLHEIAIRYAAFARSKGIERFECTEGLNDDPGFLDALAEIVLDPSFRAESARVGA